MRQQVLFFVCFLRFWITRFLVLSYVVCLCRVLLFGLIILFLDTPDWTGIYYVVKDDLGGFLLMLFRGINQRIHSSIYFNIFIFVYDAMD